MTACSEGTNFSFFRAMVRTQLMKGIETMNEKDQYLAEMACKDLLSWECFPKGEYFDINSILESPTEESEEEWVFTSVDS